MKKLFIFFFSIVCSHGIAQGITAPAPLTIEANATNVDAGNFVVSWADNSSSILVSVSLDYISGASLSFPTNTGLTLNTGYTSWTNVTSIVFYGTRDFINNALAAMTVSMGGQKTAIKINVEISSFDASYMYNPINKHFYRYISGNVTYSSARTNAGTYTFKGKTGYLVTITSQQEQDFIFNNISGNNLWFAATDEVTDGTWIIDAGPEKGTVLKTQNGPTAGNIPGVYNNWCGGEPNGAGHSEDYPVTKWNGGNCWNDLPDTYGSVAGYIVEFSPDFPAGTPYTAVYNAFVVHNNDIAFTLSSNSSMNTTNTSNYPNLFGGIQVNNGHLITVPSGGKINANKIILNGNGKVVFTDANSKWIPGTSNNLDNTFVHSPNTNSNPTYWSVSTIWPASSPDAFSSSTASHYTPYLNSQQGWSSSTVDVNQWIILNYDVPTYITGIVTQARAYNYGQWVSAANVDVSLDGITWRRVLTGASLNSNNTDAAIAYFPNVEYAKFVKVMPTTWNAHITMRVGIIAKSNNIIADGLVLRWDAANLTSYKGSGATWNDISGNANHGTIALSPTYNTLDGGSFTLNGSSQYISANAISATSGNNSRTVMIWYKSTANQNTPLLDKGAITLNTAEQLFLVYNNGVGTAGSYPPANPGGVVVCFWGNDLFFPIGSTTVFDGKWHYIAYSYNSANTSLTFCFDGIFTNTFYYWNGAWTTQTTNPFTLTSSLNTTNNQIYVGYTRARYWGFGSTYANATIPQMLMYNRSLSKDEILFNYNATKTIYGK